jgi:hypothetical protein
MLFVESFRRQPMYHFSAKADVFKMEMKPPGFVHFPPQPIHSGTLAECFKYVLTKHDGYPKSYSVRVPFEGGFGSKEFWYDEIEAISKRAVEA